MAYDEARQRVVLFGGTTNSVDLGDTWEWDGTDWLARESLGFPPGKSFSNGMCYDRGRQRTVLFGGESRGATFEWDGSLWREFNGSSNPPVGPAPLVYDSRRARVVLFIQNSAASGTGETWEYDGTSWVLRATSGPPGRSAHVLAFDVAHGRSVLYGGLVAGANAPRDTWLWDGTSWASLPAGQFPEPRLNAMLAPFFEYPPYSVVMFGGLFAGQPSDETWIWQSGTWRKAQPATRPPPRQYGAMAYDTKRRRLVLFGGIPQENNNPTLGDTWEWDGHDWLQRSPVTRPPARFRHSMVYDQTRERTVLVGGAQDLGSNPLGDQWEWDGNDWRQVSGAVPFGGRVGHGMAYDEFHRRIVLFSGLPNPSVPGGETWESDGGSGWRQRFPAVSPQRRVACAMCFDAGSGRVLMHGGNVNYFSANFDDTWEWDGEGWYQKDSDRTPGERSGHALAYDFGQRRVLLFGSNATGICWYYSPSPFAATTYGTACPGPNGPLQIAALGVPRIGVGPGGRAPFALELAGASASAPLAVALAASEGEQSLGNCTLWIQAPFLALTGTSSANGFASLPIPIPDTPELRGLTVFAQGVASELGSPLLSRGLRITIGD